MDHTVDVMAPFKMEFRERVLKSGAKRVRVHIEAEGLVFDLSEKRILETIGPALIEAIRGDFGRITATVSEATLAYREKAARAYAAGKRWALKRYAGGRTAASSPNRSDLMLSDSGRMERSVTAALTNTRPVTLTVNVAANRLNPGSFTAAAWAEFTSLVTRLLPSLVEPFADRGVNEAYEESVDQILQTSLNDIARARARRNRAWFNVVREAGRAIGMVG